MVFQNYALYPHMTVYDNMAFGLKLRKYSKEDIDKRVQEAAEILGLKEFWIVNQLTFQVVNVNVWPWVVPLSVMQKCSWWTNLCQTWMRNFVYPCVLKCENPPSYRATTIYVTHDQTEAMTLADRIVIMSATKTLLVQVLSDVWTNRYSSRSLQKPCEQIRSWIHRKPCHELH